MRVFGLIARSRSFASVKSTYVKSEICRAPAHAVEQPECAAIQIVTRDDMRPAVEHFEHCRDRGEPGCKREAARPAFQIGNALSYASRVGLIERA